MRIAPVLFNNVILSKPERRNFTSGPPDTFKKSEEESPLPRGSFKKDGEVFVRNTSYMFRGDINWEDFRQYLRTRFEDCPKVNSYVYGCSSGKEPYSMSIMFKEEFKENAGKFLPIIAKDLDANLIEKNKKLQKENNFRVSFIEFVSAYKRLGASFNNFSKYVKSTYQDEMVTLKKQVTKEVQFSQANILDDINSIDSKNPSIVMCRNMWLYIDASEYDEFTQNLYNKLGKGSVVVIGFADVAESLSKKYDVTIAQSLVKSGFIPVSHCESRGSLSPIIYEKN